VIVDSYKFLPRSFRPLYEGRGPFSGEEGPVWAPFDKRLAASRICLLSSAGLYLDSSQPPFDTEREQNEPEWGDPSWRSIPSTADAADIRLAHLHINDADIRSDPEIALPARLLGEVAAERLVGSATTEHFSVMGYQDRRLDGWRQETVPALVASLRDQQADGLVLAPA